MAYEGLLTHRRQTLHGATAQALEDLHADRRDEVYGALAFHDARSERADKAVGESIADPQPYAAFTTGWIAAMRRDGDAAVDACERGR